MKGVTVKNSGAQSYSSGAQATRLLLGNSLALVKDAGKTDTILAKTILYFSVRSSVIQNNLLTEGNLKIVFTT